MMPMKLLIDKFIVIVDWVDDHRGS